MSIYTYRQEDVVLTILGVPVEDIAKESALVLAYDEDKVSKKLDVSGGGVYSVSSSMAGSLTFSLMATSHWVGFFHSAAQLGSPMHFIVEDKNKSGNKVLASCNVSMVKKAPDLSYGSEVGEVEIVIDCIQLIVGAVPKIEGLPKL